MTSKFILALVLLLSLRSSTSWAAISAADLTTSGTNVDGTSTATASITPAANTLILAAITSEVASGTSNEPTATGNGLTWVVVNTRVQGTFRLTVFRTCGAAPSAGAVTFSFAGQTQASFTWSVVSVSGASISGAQCADAVVQSAVNGDIITTTLTVTLAAFANAANGTFGAFGIDNNVVFTAGSGFALIEQQGCCVSRTAFEWKDTNDTSVDITWVSNSRSMGVALELAPSTIFPDTGQFLSRLQ